MPINSIVTIDGTSYTAPQRATASILPTRLDRTLEGGYDTFAFWEIPTSPFPTYTAGMAVAVTIDIGDGNGFVTRFVGLIVDCQSEHGAMGWGHAYTCEGLKFLADRVPITAVDGTGTQVYNRVPNDEYFNASDAGLELGEVLRRVLCIPGTAQALNAVGVGNYTGLPSVPVLPAATLADLARLTIVPPRPVIFQGKGVLNMADQEVAQWMPKFYSEIEPGGTIRWKDTSDLAGDFVPRTITCPSADGQADPVSPPRVQRSTKACATRLLLRGGPQVEVAILSLVDGTLAEVFTSTDKTNWNLTYFTAPKGASDFGVVTAVTSTSATLQSHDNTVTWTTNFWSNNNATLSLSNSIGSLISQFETRLATSNNALSAGGSSTVNWDSTWPITNTGYDTYRITGGSGGLIDTWRTYTPREPLTGHTGLATYVGAHLVTKSAHAVRVANADQSFHSYFTTAIVKGGSLGQEMPLGVQAVPSAGMFRFTQPTVTVFGNSSTLNSGSPTTTANGKPIDVTIYALYSRGALSVVVPPDVAGIPQYEGTAFTEDGITHTETLDFPAWLWQNDTTSFAALAQQVLDTLSGTEVDLGIHWYLTPDAAGPAWDYLSFGYSLNVAIFGQSSPWSALNAPIRSIGIGWDWTGRGGQTIEFHATTRKRSFAGFDLYVHPEFASGSPLDSALTEARFGSGNYEAYDQVRKAGGLPGPGGTTAAADPDSLAAGSKGPAAGDIGQLAADPRDFAGGAGAGGGFTMRDVADAGRVSANKAGPGKGPAQGVRTPEEQEAFAKDHESPAEKRSRLAGERLDAKEQAGLDRKDARDDAKDAKEARKEAKQDAKDEADYARNQAAAGRPDTTLARPKPGSDDAFQQGIAGRGPMGPAELPPTPAAARAKADRVEENRGRVAASEQFDRDAKGEVAKAKASDDFYAGRADRNIDKQIESDRAKEEIRGRNEARDKARAHAEATRMLDASAGSNLEEDKQFPLAPEY